MMHSPAPWTVEPEIWGEDGHYEEPQIVAANGITGVATIRVGSGCDEANARLIAAAPDLLEALKRLVGPNPGTDDRDAAHDAIAKAEGRS